MSSPAQPTGPGHIQDTSAPHSRGTTPTAEPLVPYPESALASVDRTSVHPSNEGWPAFARSDMAMMAQPQPCTYAESQSAEVEDGEMKTILDMLEIKLTPFWEINEITQRDRQQQMKECALEMTDDAFQYANLSREQNKEKYEHAFFSTLSKMAVMYMNVQSTKQSSRAMTPMTPVLRAPGTLPTDLVTIGATSVAEDNSTDYNIEELHPVVKVDVDSMAATINAPCRQDESDAKYACGATAAYRFTAAKKGKGISQSTPANPAAGPSRMWSSKTSANQPVNIHVNSLLPKPQIAPSSTPVHPNITLRNDHAPSKACDAQAIAMHIQDRAFKDRVVLQHMHNTDIQQYGTSTIPDQGIEICSPRDNEAVEASGTAQTVPKNEPEGTNPELLHAYSELIDPEGHERGREKLRQAMIMSGYKLPDNMALPRDRVRFSSNKPQTPRQSTPNLTTAQITPVRVKSEASTPAPQYLQYTARPSPLCQVSVPASIVNPGVVESVDNHHQRMEGRLTTIIHEMLRNKVTIPEGFKFNQKMEITTADKYNGSAKFADLEDWLSALCYKMALSQMGGQEADCA